MKKLIIKLSGFFDQDATNSQDARVAVAEDFEKTIKDIFNVNRLDYVNLKLLSHEVIDDEEMDFYFGYETQQELDYFHQVMLIISEATSKSIQVYDFESRLTQKYSCGEFDTGSLTDDEEEYYDFMDEEYESFKSKPALAGWLKNKS